MIKVYTFEIYLSMKKVIIPLLMVISLLLYLAADSTGYGKYLKVVAMVLVMIATMQLMSKIPSKNNRNDDANPEN